MFVLDDLLFRPFVGIVDAIHTIALDELYDVDGLEDELKENQLLYELGERSGGIGDGRRSWRTNSRSHARSTNGSRAVAWR